MKEVNRIIRVDHAGEYGAINIYKAQSLIAKRFYKDIYLTLQEMLKHEKEHYLTFSQLLEKRRIRSCYAIKFWAIGGFLLGLFTAIMGRNAIWICTYAIETTVLHHLESQLKFLKEHDIEAYDAVLSIKSDEEEHRDLGKNHGEDTWLFKPIYFLVKKSTTFAIWISTKL